MPRVPQATPQVAREREQFARPQPVFSPSLGTPTAFGAAEGRARQRTGQVLNQIGDRAAEIGIILREREDALARVRDINTVGDQAREAFLAEQTGGDNFETSTSVRNYHKTVDEIIQDTLGKHSGTAGSRAELGKMLEEDRGKFHQAATLEGIRASRGALERQFTGFLNETAQTVSDAPEQVPDAMAAIEARLATYEAAVTPGELQNMRAAGNERVATAAIDHYLAVGQYELARATLDTMGSFVGADRARQMRQRIITGEVTLARAQAERAGMRQRLEAAGVEITPSIALAMEGIQTSGGKQTASQKIQELEAVKSRALGRPYQATEAEINAIFDVGGGSDAPFGTGAAGRAAQRMAEDAVDFAEGNMTAEEARFFVEAAMIAVRPDPTTGRPGSLSPSVREALARQGINPDRLGEENAAQDPDALLQRGNLEQPVRETLSSNPQIGQATQELASHTEQTRQAEGGMLNSQAPTPRRTLFGSAELLTGPISSIAAGVSRVPIIGDFLDAPETRQARAFMRAFENDFLRVLQNNPRYAEGEVTRIRKAIQLESRFIDRPNAFRDDLIGLDDELALREQNARDTIEKGKIGKEEREHAMNVLNAITKAREVIGVPPKITTREEALALPSGTVFRDPAGTLRRTP